MDLPYIRPRHAKDTPDLPASPIDCTFIRGEVAELQTRVTIWQRQAYSGYGAQRLGTEGARAEFNLVVIHYGTPEEIATWRAAIELLSGAQVKLSKTRDPPGHEVIERILVQHVSNPRTTRADTSPGTVGYRCQYELRCLRITATQLKIEILFPEE